MAAQDRRPALRSSVSARRVVAVLVPLLLASVLGARPAPAAPAPVTIATGMDAGWPDVRGWTRVGAPAHQIVPWQSGPLQFAAYSTYQYGVHVAVGDVDGDGRQEIVTAPGKGAWTELRVFDGRTFAPRARLAPFASASWWNGAFVALGDVNGDGRAEIVDGLDAGCCTTLHVVDARTGAETAGFFPFGQQADAGARVATADLNGDGKAELLSVQGGTARISAFGTGGGSPIRTYEPFAGEAVGDLDIATGDVAGSARPELLAAANTPAGVHVKVVDLQTGATLVSLHPFAGTTASPPEVAVGDVDGDGHGDVVVLAQLGNG